MSSLLKVSSNANKKLSEPSAMKSPLETVSLPDESFKTIKDWYKGRSILVTGATGFMGKVLLEKLLRSCSELEKIYIIVRPKRNMSSKTRLTEIIKLPLFQNLRENNPNVLKKLIAIEGDTTVENLGVSESNKTILFSDISIVFHCAATLRLEAVLKDSVIQNLFGTENVFKFCRGMKKLEALIYLSTAFCHCDIKVLEEKIYPPTQNPKYIMNLIEWLDDKSLDIITPSIIQPHPNTYTFTKRLAETIAYEYGSELPMVILRPSIVIPTINEPIPGWVDSLNGPVGVLAAAGKGVIRSMLVEADNHAEVMPVDIAVNGMIVAAWCRSNQKFLEPPVYNMSQSDIHPITWGEVLNRGRVQFQENPFDWPLWYPDGDIRTNRLLHEIIVFFFQIIPAYFIDLIFAIFRQKRFLVRIQKRIKLGMHLLQYFTLREWKFKNKNFLSLLDVIPQQEKDIFYAANIKFDINNYLRDIILGTRLYCLKESSKNIPWAKRYLKFLYILDRVCKIALVCGFIWMILKYINAFKFFGPQYSNITLQKRMF